MTAMQLLCLDFETYFDTDYSLKKLSTEEYVRSPLFQAHMVGYWAPDRMAAPAECRPDVLETNDDFRSLIESSAVLCHHAHFDGLILEHHYGLKPLFWLDTLSMARLVLPRLKSLSLDGLAQHFQLPAKFVPYNDFRGVRDLPPGLYQRLADGCKHDVWLTHQIFQKLLPYVPRDELKVIDATIRMFTEPTLRLDRPRLEKFKTSEQIRKAKAMLQAGAAMGMHLPAQPSTDILRQALALIETELQSSEKFRVALESLGHQCPMKWSEKATSRCLHCLGACNPFSDGSGFCETCGGTGKQKGGYIPALAKNDDGMKELLDHDDSRVQALAEARLGVKSTIDETRASRLLDSDARGALPVYLSYAAAHTLRFGGGDKCLTAEAQVITFDHEKGVTPKRIVDIMPDDLIWDGVDFVEHDGVVFQGYRDVIEYDGVEGTPDHPVCLEAETIGLSEAMRRGARLLDCRPPTSGDVERARSRAKN